MITARIVTATKDLVDALLAQNTNNRNLRGGIVNSYVREIQSGQWEITNQGVGVSENNELIDGQHRLTAIKMAGYPPVQFLLVTGLSEKAKSCVDTHAKRSARDVLKLTTGFRFSKEAPAICRTILEYTKSMSVPTMHEITETLIEYQTEIERVVETPNSQTYFAAGFLSGFVFIAKQSGRLDDVCEFMRMTEEGELLTKKMPAFHLRNCVQNTKGVYGGRDQKMERMKKAIKATEAFFSGQEMGVLRAD